MPADSVASTIVVGSSPNYRAFFELKWAGGKGEVGWTLWDIYKLAAARIEYGVGAYAIVGAPGSYWVDDNVDCSALYCDSIWESQLLFRRYERAWQDLLGGSTARPLRVPSSIATHLVAAQPLDTTPPWELRALRIEVADPMGLEFDGDWPTGHYQAMPVVADS